MFECKCDTCKNACKQKPGWFAPGEIQKAAELMSLTPKEFFDQYLSVDYWVGSKEDSNTLEDIFVLTPCTIDNGPGGMTPFNPKGICIFFKEGLCKIHAAKPLECGQMVCDPPNDSRSEKDKNTESWNKPKHQQQINDLLGYKPYREDPSLGNVFGLFL